MSRAVLSVGRSNQMLKHVLWTVLGTGLVISGALSLSACSEVESCKRGAVGCVDGDPNDGGECKLGLVPRDGKCKEPDGLDNDGGKEDGGGNNSKDDAGEASACAPCDAPALCVPERKECIDFCEAPEEVPGSGPDYQQITCGGEKDAMDKPVVLDFAQTCKNTCLVSCRWENWFCPGSKRDCAADCDKPNVQAECALPVTGCGSDVTCQKTKCVNIRALGCQADAMLCPNSGGMAPKCDAITCTNKCADQQSADANTFDGFCDDGAYTFSETDLCPFGTDCADCGPRTGAARPVDVGDIKLGEPCPNSARCAGRSSDYDLNKSWCLDVAGDVARCLVDCSGDDERCPTGFKCQELSSSAGTALMDRNGRRGKVCFPTNLDQCI